MPPAETVMFPNLGAFPENVGLTKSQEGVAVLQAKSETEGVPKRSMSFTVKTVWAERMNWAAALIAIEMRSALEQLRVVMSPTAPPEMLPQKSTLKMFATAIAVVRIEIVELAEVRLFPTLTSTSSEFAPAGD